jgi:hypothetical protein
MRCKRHHRFYCTVCKPQEETTTPTVSDDSTSFTSVVESVTATIDPPTSPFADSDGQTGGGGAGGDY